MKVLFNLIVFMGITSMLMAQRSSDSETINLDLNGVKKIGLFNHRGNVSVKGTNSSQATVKYTRRLKSASQKRLQEAQQEIKLSTMNEGSEVFIFIEAPNMHFTIDSDGHGYYKSENWNGWKNRYEVDWEFEIELEIPADMDLTVSNHHSELEVENVRGFVYAKNHHKDVILNNVGKNVLAKTHHGDIEVYHTENPNEDCYYKTHHGDIKVTYQKGFNAEVKFKTHHGSLFSDFDWKYGPTKTASSKSEKGTLYKIGKETTVSIGSGNGPHLDFKTHHGSIYLMDDKS